MTSQETNSNQIIESKPLLLQARSQEILRDWNNTQTRYPRDKTVPELFEQQVQSSPDALALCFQKETISYQVLNERANQLARVLEKKGIQPNTFVGICLERSPELIVGILAILKIGAAYLPLDPENPTSYLEFMIADADCTIILTQSELSDKFPETATFLLIDQIESPIARESVKNIGHISKPNTPAYINYTSGSTGISKGVVVCHQNIVRLTKDSNYVQLNTKDVVAHAANISFDAATFEIWGALLNGSSLILMPKNSLMSPESLQLKIQEEGITTMFITTAALNQIVDAIPNCFESLKNLLFGGEQVSNKHIRQLMSHGKPQRLLHVYGPTENTTFSSWYEVLDLPTDEHSVPIGRAISNSTLYLLDEDLKPVSVGEKGEIYVGGDGVALGYLNQPKLTQERFLQNPFGSGRLYKTGDFGQWLLDSSCSEAPAQGVIEFLGRADHQIKLRGYRIELGSIEAQMRQLDCIKDVLVVLNKDDPNNPLIVAYYCGTHQDSPVQELKDALQQELPAYMVPSIFMSLEKFPLTPNGKINRALLPPPCQPATPQETQPEPFTENQELLLTIWKKLLKNEKIGIHDNFFELGGHSLLGTRFISILRRQFNIELPIDILFEKPTISELAHEMEGETTEAPLPDIIPLTHRDNLPLSYAQQRLWFIDQLEGGSHHYNIVSAFTLSGTLDKNAFRQAVNSLVERHEVLRTQYAQIEGQAIQRILNVGEHRVPLIEVDLSHLEESLRQIELTKRLDSEAVYQFDLKNDILVRWQLVRLSIDCHAVFLNIHHIAADGWSMGVFAQEFSQLYATYKSGETPEASPLPQLKVQYADYANWQKDWLQGAFLDEQLNYWTQQLNGIPKVHNFPLDHIRPNQQSYRGKTTLQWIDQGLTQSIHGFCQKHEVTLFMFLQTAFTVLLHRYSNESDIVMGSPIAGRRHKDLEPLIGFFVNTLVLRSDLSSLQSSDSSSQFLSFEDLLANNKKMILEAYAHQDLPFEVLVETLASERNLGHTPLFQIMFVLQNNEAAVFDLPDLKTEPLEPNHPVSKFDICLHITEKENGLELRWEYALDLFESVTIEKVSNNFNVLLEGLIKNPKASLDVPPLMNAEEKQQIMQWSKDYSLGYEKDKCLHEFFEEQVQMSPNAVAVIYDRKQQSHTITYQALNERANQLARHLIQQGLKADTLVGLGTERSLEMVIGVLGILKAGGGYLPLDPTYPQKRTTYMLEQGDVQIILTQESIIDQWRGYSPKTICLDDPATLQILDNYPAHNLEAETLFFDPKQLLCVMYTSGSTGVPKGVMLEQAGIIRLVKNNPFVPMSSNTIQLHSAPITFDTSLLETWGPLLNGGQLVLYPEPELNLRTLNSTILQHHVNSIWLTARLFDVFVSLWQQPLPALQYIFVGGEVVNPQSVQQFYKHCPNARVVNGYGPTENSTFSSCYIVPPNDPKSGSVSIGQPIPQSEVFVLNDRLELQPIGAVGELYLGGAGLARGYLNQPSLTDERFIPSPFGGKDTTDRLYKTGDLGRWLPRVEGTEGLLEFHGRTDHQVKIRGHRIELQEIEIQLSKNANIQSCAVLAIEGKHLVAFVVPSQGLDRNENPSDQQKKWTQGYKNTLKAELPAYMIPEFYIFLETLPLSGHNKIDRNALEEQARLQCNLSSRTVKDLALPQTSMQKSLVQIWGKVLFSDEKSLESEVQLIGITDNFFEIGGHSLMAVKLIHHIQVELHRSLTLKDLFEHPTIEQLSEHLEKKEDSQEPLYPIIQDASQQYEPFPMTDVQQAYWMGRKDWFELGGVGTHEYKEVFFPQLDLEKYTDALNRLIQRHAMLRMVVLPDGTQRILQDVPRYEISVLDLREQTEAEGLRLFHQLREHLSYQVFSGEEWPLFDIQCTVFDDQSYKLHFSIDALITDAGSIEIIFDELQALYEDPSTELPPLGLSFRDYVISDTHLRKTELYTQSKHYWMDRINDFPLSPELPIHSSAPTHQKHQFERRSASLEKSLWSHLQKQIQKIGVTPTVFLLSCFSEIIYQWSKKSHFALNLTLFNRTPFHPHIDHLVGDFSSLTLLEVDLRDPKPFTEKLRSLQSQLWDDIEHKHFSGIEVLRQLSNAFGEQQIMPIVVTSALGMVIKQERDDDYSITQTPQVWLDHQIYEQDGQLKFNWDFVADLFPPDMIDAMFNAYVNLLHQLGEETAEWQAHYFPIHSEHQTFVESHLSRGLPLLHELFFERAAQQPHAIAVQSNSKTLTYQELQNLSWALGNELYQKGAKPNQLVAFVLEKGWEQIVASMGILCSGAAYLPIDATLPEERILRLLEIGEVHLVVSTSSIAQKINLPSTLELFELDEMAPVPPSTSTWSLRQNKEDLAYVIFTSGSTGEPKGVMIDHQGAVNTVLDINQRYQITDQDRVLALSSMSFDLSVYDVFGVLAAGGSLRIVQQNELRDPKAWLDYLINDKITLWNSVPALMQMLIEFLEGQPTPLPLRLALLSGDWIPLSLPDRIKAYCDTAEVISLGGATEASIWSIYHPIQAIDPNWISIPYGKALENQAVYVLKENLTLCPTWVPGELYIAGIGLAQGYWKDEAQTEERFMIHPETQERLYKTGDWGRYFPDGSIEFLGREDQQVKIRGHRVELGEIETQLIKHPLVTNAVVDLHSSQKGDQQLVAYFTSEKDKNIAVFQGEEVGALQNKEDIIVDPLERTLFALQQHGIRHFDSKVPQFPLLETTEQTGLLLTQHRTKPLTFDDTCISFEQFSRVFQCFSQKVFETLPTPKYYYPSAGSLYPVQVYVFVQPKKVKGLEGGYYYYNPGKNSLFQVSNCSQFPLSGDPETEVHRTGFTIMLIENSQAILPMYGALAHDFSQIEAGTMGQLLEKSLPADLGISPIHQPIWKHLTDGFGLDSSHVLLRTFVVGSTHSSSSKAPKQDPCKISYVARKSYRSYQNAPIPLNDFNNFISNLQRPTPTHSEETKSLKTYCFIRQGRVTGIQGGLYQYMPDHTLRSLETSELSHHLLKGNERLAEQMGFLIFFVSSPPSNGNKQSREDALYHTGYLGQQLMNFAPMYEIGLCMIGTLDHKIAQAALQLEQHEEVLHSIAGGKIDRQQIENFDVAPSNDPSQILQQSLAKALPDYMIPQVFIPLEHLPLTSNGKVDRSALPAPDSRFYEEKQYIPPQSNTEKQLADLWKQMLGIQSIGLQDNFLDQGGNSIIATQLKVKIDQSFSINFPLRFIFEKNNLDEQANEIELMLLAQQVVADNPSQSKTTEVLL